MPPVDPPEEVAQKLKEQEEQKARQAAVSTKLDILGFRVSYVLPTILRQSFKGGYNSSQQPQL